MLTDGRFSGGTPGLSIGHTSSEATEGGTIGLIHEGDMIKIDIPDRSINLKVSDGEPAARCVGMEVRGSRTWKPEDRDRHISATLRVYDAMATSADRDAVRDVSQVERQGSTAATVSDGLRYRKLSEAMSEAVLWTSLLLRWLRWP